MITTKFIFSAFFIFLAIMLFVASMKGFIKNETVDRLDKIASVVSLLVGLGLIFLPDNLPTPSTNTFAYTVRISDSRSDISDAYVRIELNDGSAPVRQITDADGFARFILYEKHLNQPARIIVKAEGYQEKELIIDLRGNESPLPVQLKLEQ